MKAKSIFFTALFALAFSFSAQAQLGGLLNKAKEAAKKKEVKTAETKQASTQSDNAKASSPKAR